MLVAAFFVSKNLEKKIKLLDVKFNLRSYCLINEVAEVSFFWKVI